LKTVTVAELESRFDELIDLAASGEEIIITSKGREVARLLPRKCDYEENVPLPMRGFGQ
jgi:prevent-host-death family protein